MKKLLFFLLVPVFAMSQKMGYKNDVKFRIGLMKMVVERNKADEIKFRDAQYKILNFLTFSDDQKQVLDTLFSNSWNKRMVLFNKINNDDITENKEAFVKYLLKFETQFRSCLTENQKLLYSKTTQDFENQKNSKENILLKGFFFSDEKYAEYQKKLN